MNPTGTLTAAWTSRAYATTRIAYAVAHRDAVGTSHVHRDERAQDVDRSTRHPHGLDDGWRCGCDASPVNRARRDQTDRRTDAENAHRHLRASTPGGSGSTSVVATTQRSARAVIFMARLPWLRSRDRTVRRRAAEPARCRYETR